MSSSALVDSFHGQEGAYERGTPPGSGGNMNSVYSGYAQEMEGMPGYDTGYTVGAFPAGRIPTGTEAQEFRISDSKAFNSLRGIAKTSFPYDPNPAQDHPNQSMTSLADKFQVSDLGGISSLMPGKYSYNNKQGSLSKHILDEHNAGVSTYNSLPNAASAHGSENFDEFDRFGTGVQDTEVTNSIEEQFRLASIDGPRSDLPMTPFHKTYPNFGNGKVDYGFSEPGADKMSEDIVRAYAAVLPEGELAGAKQDLMPVFSGINHAAVEQRPILQSLGKNKNTLYLGGVVELPDELRIDPRQSLMAGSYIPTGVEQTSGELASALEVLGYFPGQSGFSSTSDYGQMPRNTRVLSGTSPAVDPRLYQTTDYADCDPYVFAGEGHHMQY